LISCCFQHEQSANAALGSVDQLQQSSVQLNDRLGHRQTKPGAFASRLGGEKGIEDFYELVFGNSVAGVVDLRHHHDLAGAKPLGTIVAHIMTERRQLLNARSER